jgi:O-antigen ligase
MDSLRKSKKHVPDIADFYAVRVGALWAGLKGEHVCFWALCSYFFFEYVRPQSIYPVIDVIPWAQISLLITLVTVFSDRSVKWVSNIENKLFFLFAIIIILSGIFAFMPQLSWHGRNIMLGWFLVYFLVINIINSEKRLFLFTLAYLLFSFKMSQHGFLSWAGRGFSFANWGLIGAGGWFQNSGEFAIQMLVFGTLSAGFVVALKRYWGRYKKWFFYLMPFTAFMSVIGASSRGAQLALAVIGVIVLLKAKAGLKVLIPLLLVAAVAFYFLPDEQKQRFTEMGGDKTSLERLEYWKFGLEVMHDYPVIGVGYRNWWRYYFSSGKSRGWAMDPHNIFILAGAELGYTGLACFILMVLFVFIINARTRHIAKKLDNNFLFYMAHGLDAGLVGFLAAGFFVTVLYYPFFWVQMAMTVALFSISDGLLTNVNCMAERRQLQYRSAGKPTPVPIGCSGTT